MPIPAHLRDYWHAFSAAMGGVDDARFYEAFYFGDSEMLANELAALVLKGSFGGAPFMAGSTRRVRLADRTVPRPFSVRLKRGRPPLRWRASVATTRPPATR